MTHTQTIGQRLIQLRDRMTQDALATEMRDRGIPWAKATVWKVETDQRELRLAEAVELGKIFGVPITAFVADEDPTPQARRLIAFVEMGATQLAANVRRARKQIARIPEPERVRFEQALNDALRPVGGGDTLL